MENGESFDIPKPLMERLRRRGQKLLELVSDRWLVLPGPNQETPSFRNHIEELAPKEESNPD